MKNTTHYGLKKPDGTDAVDIGIINQNMDTIDATMKSNANQISDLKNNKANTSHGNHVPATQTANNKKFLRCDNTWQDVTPANIGAAAASHTHTKSQISDFPNSLPANGGNADTVGGRQFIWQGQPGQPTWVWGANEPGNQCYVWNPATFSVRNADYVQGRNLAAEFDSLKSAVSNPNVVKSVQRGFIEADQAGYVDRAYSKDYAISAVNPSKTMINLYTQSNYNSVCGRLMNGTTLRIYATSSDNFVKYVSWEVIEFY